MMKNVKRILSAVIAGALLCTGSVFSTVSAEETNLRGDVNKDGLVRTEDAVYILYYYNGVVMDDESHYLEHFEKHNVTIDTVLASDINEDGVVDCDDAVFILKYYVISILDTEMTPEEIWEQALKQNPENSYPIGTEKGDLM